MSVDVLVIGGGIVGCAIARHASRAGASVRVLERGSEPRQASWAAAGMLAPQAESDAPSDFLTLLIRAREGFPHLAGELLRETGIDTGYRTDGFILMAFTEADERGLNARWDWQSSAGLNLQRLDASAVGLLEPAASQQVRSGVLFPDDHQIENRLLTRALMESARTSGAEFRTGSAVVGLRRDNGLRVVTDSGEEMSAGKVVLAAGSWSGQIQGLPRALPVTPVHGQLLSVSAPDLAVRHVLASPRGYLVPRADGTLIIGATSERVGFREGTTLSGLQSLASIALEMCPSLESRPVLAHWAGLRPGTPDDLPILGPDPDLPDLLYATGHYRNGILLAPLTGEIIGALAVGADPGVDLTPYRPDRFPRR